MIERRKTGICGELVSARYLRRKGYEILDTNFHSRYGEIDIIAQKDDTVIFVEVKTRNESAIAAPSEAVNFAKQKKIKSTALYYLTRFEREISVRFDVVEVIVKNKDDRKLLIRHIPNAFD